MGPSTKWGAPIVLTLRLEDEHRLFEENNKGPQAQDMARWLKDFPGAWAETAGAGEAKHQPPVVIELKSSATPVAIRQYPMTREAREGIQPHIARLLQLGILVKCQSPWNTPLLPVKKPGTNDYRPVQDLREVNKRVQDIHPTVPNPYNLLSSIPPDRVWYTVLDLKDAFFCLKLHPESQRLFAFEWRDPDTGSSGQLTWTRLPQGFKNSPTIFDEALHKDLAEFRTRNPQVTLLQYVDDLLLAGATQEDCLDKTRWVEAYPTRHETAAVMAKKILKEIFPRFGLPKVIGSDNGPAFVAQVSQGMARVLGINWKLHCAYHPQSSGQVERMNRTLKETMTKLSIETGVTDWTALLPYALFRARNTPN